MKKIVMLLFLLLLLTACSSDDKLDDQIYNEDSNDTTYNSTFQATIIENDNGLMVEPLAGEGELKSADKITVSTTDVTFLDEHDKELEKEDFKIGQTVEIRYDGMIAESYPAQILHCDRIQLIKEKD